jgi:hypothetical protein
VIDKFKTVQMVEVQLPTTDGRELTLSLSGLVGTQLRKTG